MALEKERKEPKQHEALPGVETERHFDYRFNPAIEDNETAEILADIINKYVYINEGGVAAEARVAVTKEGKSVKAGAVYVLRVPKRLYKQEVEKMFAAMNQTKRVNISIGSESYPEFKDPRRKVTLKPGEHVVANVNVAPGGEITRAGWRILDSQEKEIGYIPAAKRLFIRRKGHEDPMMLLSMLTASIETEFNILQEK